MNETIRIVKSIVATPMAANCNPGVTGTSLCYLWRLPNASVERGCKLWLVGYVKLCNVLSRNTCNVESQCRREAQDLGAAAVADTERRTKVAVQFF